MAWSSQTMMARIKIHAVRRRAKGEKRKVFVQARVVISTPSQRMPSIEGRSRGGHTAAGMRVSYIMFERKQSWREKMAEAMSCAAKTARSVRMDIG